MTNSRLVKAYSTLFPFLFIFNGYGIGNLGIGIGSLLLLFFVFISLLDHSKTARTIDDVKPLLLLISYIIISLFDYFIEPNLDMNGLLVTSIKMVIWASSISILSPLYFDIDVFFPFFRKFCLACTIYLVIQNIAWVLLGVFIPNLFTIGPIHPLYEQYSQDTLKEYIITTNWTRFSSFFSEPAFYGHMIIVDIVLLLFGNGIKKLEKNKVVEIIILSIGIILSTSTAAILFLVIVISWYLIRSNKAKHLLLLMVLSGFVVVLLLFSPLKNHTSVEFFFEKLSNMNSLSRVGKSYEKLSLLNFRQIILGVGLGNTSIIAPGYLNSIATIIISFGLVGLLFFIIFSLSLMIRKKEGVLVLMVLYLIGSFQGAIAFSMHGILYLCVAIAMINKNKKVVNL